MSKPGCIKCDSGWCGDHGVDDSMQGKISQETARRLLDAAKEASLWIEKLAPSFHRLTNGWSMCTDAIEAAEKELGQ